MDIYIGGKDRMYELFENVSNNDFIWIQCIDSFEKREVVRAFINKGYISKLEEIDYAKSYYNWKRYNGCFCRV